ncbi:hypothetical protein MAR_021525, partial [Mya arenaria]
RANHIIETTKWLGTAVDNSVISEILPDGYNFCHVSRSERRGGGVGLVYQLTINVKSVQSFTQATHFEHMECDISTNSSHFILSSLYRPPSIEGTNEELVERYNTGLQELLDKHAPLQTKVITIRPNTPWYNDSLRAAKRNRRKAERKMRKSNLTFHTEIYKEACIIYNKLMLQTKKDYYSSKIEENSNNRCHLFKLTNTLMGCKRDTVLPSTDNDKSLANKFCDFFIGKIISIRNKLSENQTDNDVLRADV